MMAARGAQRTRHGARLATDFDVSVWYALFLPKGTPAAIVLGGFEVHEGVRIGSAAEPADRQAVLP
jgi:hypothetical protein